MAKTAEEIWQSCIADIRGRVSATQYANFFEPIAFESFDSKARTLQLQVPNRQLVEYLEGSFMPLLSAVLGAHFGQIRLQYHNMESVVPTTDAVIDVTPHAAESVTIATHLNPHYTFATFIEGGSNKLARSVGLTIAEHPRRTNFNPMFVYGPSGCGKTHLLNAIGNRACELYPKKKIIYLSSREFQLQYTTSKLNNKINDFLHNYYQFDMLLVDDVQEWEGKTSTSETFFHIFNHLFMSGKHIILAADRTPAELRSLDDRMLSRFSCGIMAELGKPDYKLCHDILLAKIRRDGLVIPSEVVDYIAQNANGSVRDLEGVINSLLAYSTFITGDINMPLVQQVVARIQREKPEKVTPETILAVVSEHCGVTLDALTGKSHKQECVRARQIAMFFLRHNANVNVNAIGRMIGNRNHATVGYGIERVAQMIQNDAAFAQEIKEIESKILSAR